MKIRQSIPVIAIVALVGAAPMPFVFAQSSAPQSTLAAGDQQFVQDASQADATEIAASRLALKNSKNARVKQFAQQMIKDHTRLSHGLAAIAKTKGLQPSGADSAMIGKLQTLKGTQFDQAYVEQIAVEGHTKAVQLFTTESQSGGDPQLKQAATKALPTIQHHLEMAQQLAAGTMKGSS